MGLDLAQFHESFFEESFEALDAMEAALLKLEVGVADHEGINTIFRGAHSMKGGAAMLSFDDVSSFTHTLETLLDELRSGRMQVSAPILDSLLKSVDVLREMLRAVKGKQPIDAQRVADIQFELEAIVAGKSASITAAPTASAAPPPGWTIHFEPLPHLLLQGNDPLAIFAALKELGRVEPIADISRLPPLNEMDPQFCYLGWQVRLHGDCAREQIEETFDWTTGDCELRIEPGALTSDTASASAPPAAAAATPATAVPPPTSLPTTATPPSATSPTNSAPPSATFPTNSVPPPAASTPAPPTDSSTKPKPSPSDSTSIRVGIEKIDELINTVGELVITQAMLTELGRDFAGADADLLRSGLGQLERTMRQLQEGVMRVRMLPISVAFSRFPRMVHDLAQRSGKKVELTMTGEQTELDKTVLEKMGDPLVHLVRNSIDHGIELPDARAAAGKSPSGTITLNAYHSGGNIAVEISDDGAGLNIETPDAPGGVGMDVVRQRVAELGGSIDIRSEAGQGSRFRITLPLTLSIVDGQSVLVGTETYIVPLTCIVESLQLQSQTVSRLSGSGEVFPFRGEYLPILRMSSLFGMHPCARALQDGLIVVVEGDGKRVGLFVDEMQGQQQVVIKSLESNYGRIEGISGATILGNGQVALIVDVPGLIRAAA